MFLISEIAMEQNIFLQKFKQGQLGHHSGNFMSLTSILIDHNEVGFKECIVIKQCPFYRLGFPDVWVGKLASYKHLYHYWCALLHFSFSSKCIHLTCEKEMHKSWWSCVGIAKPRTIMVAKPILETSRPKLPKHFGPSPKDIGRSEI
jgi:hypothetical protein